MLLDQAAGIVIDLLVALSLIALATAGAMLAASAHAEVQRRLRTIGVLELSPGQEPNPNYVAHLVALAKANHVKAVFAEPEYSPKLVQALAESAGISTIQTLYDDSLGTSGPVKDYESMLRYDTQTIVRALGGKP